LEQTSISTKLRTKSLKKLANPSTIQISPITETETWKNNLLWSAWTEEKHLFKWKKKSFTTTWIRFIFYIRKPRKPLRISF